MSSISSEIKTEIGGEIFRYLLSPLFSFYSGLFCVLALVAHFFAKEMRASPYNSVIYSILIIQLCMCINLFIEALLTYNSWTSEFDYLYEHEGLIVISTMRGMFACFITFGGSFYYVSLSNCINTLVKEFNARDKINTLYYHLFPILAGLACLIFAITQINIGIKDLLFDGITDGSISELLHIFIVFMIMPYLIYSIITVLKGLKKIGLGESEGNNSTEDEEPDLERKGTTWEMWDNEEVKIRILDERRDELISLKREEKKVYFSILKLYRRHIAYVVVFMLTWFPASVAELLPLLVKGVHNTTYFTWFKNICIVLCSLGGLFTSLVRILDPHVQHRLRKYINQIYNKLKLYTMPDINSRLYFVLETNARKTTPIQVEQTEETSRLILQSPIYPQPDDGDGDIFDLVKENAVHEDILCSLAGICLMINHSYTNFKQNKNFKKAVMSILKGASKKKGDSIKEEKLEELTYHKTFTGEYDFTQEFVDNHRRFKNFQIEMEEHAHVISQSLRILHKYTQDEFYESLKPKTNKRKLQELFDSTSGRGGMPIFSTQNKKFIIKQLTKYEKNTLLKTFLSQYQAHVIKNSSYLCRILGLFSLRINKKKKITIIIMQNVDPVSSKLIDFKYDMKMSTVKRATLNQKETNFVKNHYLGSQSNQPPNSQGSRNIYKEIMKEEKTTTSSPEVSSSSSSKLKVRLSNERESGEMNPQEMPEFIKGKLFKLKDVDFQELHGSLPIDCPQEGRWVSIMSKIRKDVEFLKSINIMDYSLIISVVRTGGMNTLKRRGEEVTALQEQLAVAERNGNVLYSPSREFAYLFGIIDILQEYDLQKILEGVTKKTRSRFKGKRNPDISCQPPPEYAQRFLANLPPVFQVDRDLGEEGIGGRSLLHPHNNVPKGGSSDDDDDDDDWPGEDDYDDDDEDISHNINASLPSDIFSPELDHLLTAQGHHH